MQGIKYRFCGAWKVPKGLNINKVENGELWQLAMPFS